MLKITLIFVALWISLLSYVQYKISRIKRYSIMKSRGAVNTNRRAYHRRSFQPLYSFNVLFPRFLPADICMTLWKETKTKLNWTNYEFWNIQWILLMTSFSDQWNKNHLPSFLWKAFSCEYHDRKEYFLITKERTNLATMMPISSISEAIHTVFTE